MTIIGVTGHDGRLGSMLVEKGFVPLDCDLLSSDEIAAELDRVKPDIVINCAAYTDVDGAQSNQLLAQKVNGEGVLNLRMAHGGWLIHMSTDYVFGGGKGPYSEKFDLFSDLSRGAYGQSKVTGELHILNFPRKGTVLRTTMLYGNPRREDFVSKVITQLGAEKPIEVPSNIIGSPTYIPHLIEGILALISKYRDEPPSILNIAGCDVLSRYEFALMIASLWRYDKSLIVPTRKRVGIAPRPHKAGLKVTLAKKLGIPLYSSVDGLEAYKNDLGR